MKVNDFNNIAKDTLDEWVYFFKNSEVKDGFKAKGLKEAGEVLDIMRLPKSDEYSYNRYLDFLHYKASEAFTLRLEAEDKVRHERDIKIAEKLIMMGTDNQFIADATGLLLENINKLRADLKKNDWDQCFFSRRSFNFRFIFCSTSSFRGRGFPSCVNWW